MDERRDATEHEEDRSTWLVLAKACGIILLTVALYLLGHQMVVHHFFAGGALNNNQGHLVGP